MTEVASNDDFGQGGQTSRVRFKAASGTVYRIRVDGLNGATGTINLHLHQDPPPANDNLASAVVLSGASTSRLDDRNEGATLEAGEDDSVAGTAGGASVWYMWTAPASGQTTIDTEMSDLNTLLGVYTGGSVNALTEVAGNDDWQTEFTSQVTFAATMGTVYRIRVDGGDADTGTINLHLHARRRRLTTVCERHRAVGPSASRTDDTNTGATLEAGEPPTVAASPAGASIWYSWTAPEKGEVTIDTATSSFDTLLGIYTGSAVGSLSPVASNDDGGVLLTSRVTFPVTVSTVYKVRVDGFLGDSGTVNLHLAFATVPGAPTGVAATAGPGQATVSWTAPASDGGSAIIGYVVTSFIGGVAQSTKSVGVVTQTIVAGLTNGTTYTFRVAALNGVGPGLRPRTQSRDSAEAQSNDHGDQPRSRNRGLGHELYGCGDGAGRCGELLELGLVLELRGCVYDDRRRWDVLREVRPVRERDLQRGAAGDRVSHRSALHAHGVEVGHRLRNGHQRCRPPQLRCDVLRRLRRPHERDAHGGRRLGVDVRGLERRLYWLGWLHCDDGRRQDRDGGLRFAGDTAAPEATRQMRGAERPAQDACRSQAQDHGCPLQAREGHQGEVEDRAQGQGDLAEPEGREEARARREGQPRSEPRQALEPLPEVQERALGPRT